jgi:ketosteroid isomerase-like protein
MKIRLRFFLVLGSIFVHALAAAVHSQTVDALPSNLKSAVAEYDRAWNAKDTAAVGRILADDYVYFSSTGDLTTRKATLDFLASPDYKLTFAERTEVKLLSKSDAVALITSRWKGRGMFGKEVINDDQRCGLVFVWERKRWKLISEHCVQIVSK